MNSGIQRIFSLITILAVGGIVVSSVSLQHHFATSKTAYCDFGNTFNCDIVNRSEYSSVLGIPVALIGLVGYAAVLALSTLYRERQGAPSLIFGGAGAGLAFALYLTYIEARVLGVWCIVCLSSLAIISVLTLVSGGLWFKSRESSL